MVSMRSVTRGIHLSQFVVRALSLWPIQGQRPTGVVINAAGFAQLSVSGPDPPRVSMKHGTDIGPPRRDPVMWFRRDLRLADNPALVEAVDEADEVVVPLFVFDPRLWDPAGPTRRAYLLASLEALRERIGGLVIRRGDPVDVLSDRRTPGRRPPAVHIAEDFGPYGTATRPAMSRRRWATLGVDAGPDRVAVRRLAGPGAQPAATTVPGLHAVLARPGASTAGGSRRATPRSRPVDTSLRSRRHGRRPTLPDGTDPADRRRGGRPPALAGRGSSGTSPTTPTSATGPTSTPPRACRCT